MILIGYTNFPLINFKGRNIRNINHRLFITAPSIDKRKYNGDHVMKMLDEGPGSQLSGQIGQVSGSIGMMTKQQQDEANQRPQYSMPGILHFLQTEWSRFEMERSQWEVERAELQSVPTSNETNATSTVSTSGDISVSNTSYTSTNLCENAKIQVTKVNDPDGEVAIDSSDAILDTETSVCNDGSSDSELPDCSDQIL
ncbi:hypothetical protein KUTeg_009188 [Tegillarca granosa]|uniref:Striatin N-terminal domain-containing protein n=1 Tax=Tegillarca granosa TaxID=220873 RepID=A0ABQ9FAL4_TEGGR|nr:hypothetical protein KUTeg_009188 [Tegillarca granosa]